MKTFPNAEEITFKDKFVERYSSLTDWDQFKTCSLSFLRRSIRVNTLKISVKELQDRLKDTWNLTPIPWCKEGFWIEHKEKERRDIGNLVEHTLGYIYTQEAASMIPPLAMEPQEHERILDMAASPGSKTTQIVMYMNNTGLLIANDYTTPRMKPLCMNIQRMGITNTLVTLMKGQWFRNMECDRILVDAPCSGTGTIRKSLKTLRMWNPNMIKRLAGTQKQMLDIAFSNVKKNGTLIYSTCSLEPHENEEVVDVFLKKHENAHLEPIGLPSLKKTQPIMEFEGTTYSEEIKKCLRLWPQDNDTEGFFVAKILKT